IAWYNRKALGWFLPGNEAGQRPYLGKSIMMITNTWNRIFKGAMKLALPVAIAAPAFLAQPVSAALVDAITKYDGIKDSTLPAKLSQTGLYDNIASKARKVTAGITAFEVNSPLWSDAAHKTRWIAVPAGKKVTPSDSDHYQYPAGTVFIK